MPPLTATEIINGSPPRSPRTKGAHPHPMMKKASNVEAKDTKEGVEVVDHAKVKTAAADASSNNSTSCIAEIDADQSPTTAESDPMQLHHRAQPQTDTAKYVELNPHDNQNSDSNIPYDAALVDDYNPSSPTDDYGVPIVHHPDMPVPSVKMQRRRSSLDATACAEIGEAAAEHLQQFLETTQLERTDSGGNAQSRRYSGDDADELAKKLEAADNNFAESLEADRDNDHNTHDHGAFLDNPERIAPARCQTASPTLPGQTSASYKQYIDPVPSQRRRGSNASSAPSHTSATGAQGPGRCYLPVRTFHMDEIVVGRLLGTGTFNDVYEAFLVPRQRSVYGRQTSLPTILTAERERKARQLSDDPILGLTDDLCAEDRLDVDRPEQGKAQAQDAASASYQLPVTYGQMALNNEPSSRSIRRRPSVPSSTSSSNSHRSRSEPRYVLKHLKDVVMEDYDTFLTGAVDLAVEAKMLSHLHHPNIIRLEGVTAGSLSDALSTGIVGGYFLVLEMLEISLLDQIVKWSVEKKVAKQSRRPSIVRLVKTLSSQSLTEMFNQGGDNESKRRSSSVGEEGRAPRRRSSVGSVTSGSSLHSLGEDEEDQDQSNAVGAAPPTTGTNRPATREPMFLYHRRLTVAAEIAAGFAYLHRKNILYRDAKPQNIGLDHNGTVKIFDMGLAKELREGDKRKHTGNCGTKRYMSPECGRFDHYGLSSDVYSFSLLLWEILALERPYAKLTAKDFSEKVYFGSMRPTIPSKWPGAIRELLPDCWTNEKNERPTMETIANILRNMAEEAEAFAPRYAPSTSSRSLNDVMSESTSVVSEAPSNQGAVAGGKARPSMLRRPSSTRGSFRIGGSSRSLAGGPSKVSSNEGVVVPKNIRKWLEAQEKIDSNLDNETMRMARTGGASRAAAAATRRNSANNYKRPSTGDSIEQKDSFQESQESHDPLAVSTGESERRSSFGSASTGSHPSAKPKPDAVGAMAFPARAISRRASTRHF